MPGIVDRIVRESGVPDLLEVLAERLAPTDLQSLLLEVYRRRAATVSPARLLEQYAANRLVRPSTAAPARLLDFDRLALSLAASLWEPLELAPLCPLGAVSVVASIDQNQTVATVRNTELVSDATNVLALECALRRRAARRDPQAAQRPVRLCASHRLLRPQADPGPGTLMHFRLFGLCSAGRDGGAFRFEAEALREHLAFYLGLLQAVEQIGCSVADPRVALTRLDGAPPREQLERDVLQPLGRLFPDASLQFDDGRASGRGYYAGVCFVVAGSDRSGTEHVLVDGGLTAWTQRLLSDRKERLLISGIGSERVCDLFQR